MAYYKVYYDIHGNGSISHCSRQLNLSSPTIDEAIKALVQSGAVSRQNEHNIEIKNII